MVSLDVGSVRANQCLAKKDGRDIFIYIFSHTFGLEEGHDMENRDVLNPHGPDDVPFSRDKFPPTFCYTCSFLALTFP